MFILMFPFFLFLSMIFFIISFIFLNVKFSFYIHWVFFCSSFYVSFPVYLDYISCIFMGMVLLISGSILFYSEYYMSNEVFKSRFFYLMFLFIMSMIFLILCPNFFCMLLGWDGLGLISFCLVLYYHNYNSLSCSMITALTNRVGDVFIIGSISMFFSMGGFSYMNFLNYNELFWMSLLFFIASMTKSAQIPFSAWLPAAMAAPTPVSSLVHSSTLVTAGIYIMIRFNFFFSDNMKVYMMLISLLTMIMSGISGLMENDLKKIIALSTLSQLGFMMFSISLSYYDLAFFHLICHASFKALLFMCAGLLIHQFSDNQDIRYYGFLDKNYFFTICMFNVSNLSLCGFPFLSGFFSKDIIIELCLKMNMNFLLLFLVIFGTFLTVFYSFRLLIFLSMKNFYSHSYFFFNMNNMNMNFSMLFLFFFSMMFGYLGSNLILLPYNYIVFPFFLKVFILSICLFSFMFCLFFSKVFFLKLNYFIYFFWNMWFLSFLKTDFFKHFLFSFSLKSSKFMYGFVEDLFGLKSVYYLKNLSVSLNKFFFLSVFNLFILFSFFFMMFLVFCY
uniref:NADH-ubiquinone oxidoreductase chain 5 n=1 Tax=Taeniothrips tigris TaxID=2824824 RepID=A0A8A9WNR1_9NEOP|nr:NADH dehydrogenase subunit 5 [Taeniothrips tigris]QTT60731.1 NADH dehydrogenase subunit 5 [Taeniothrips tigris]